MLIEVKECMAKLAFSQEQTHRALDALCRKGNLAFAEQYVNGHAGINGHTERMPIRYDGFHVVRFSGTHPDDSCTILWDARNVTRDELVDLLSFRVYPGAPHAV